MVTKNYTTIDKYFERHVLTKQSKAIRKEIHEM